MATKFGAKFDPSVKFTGKPISLFHSQNANSNCPIIVKNHLKEMDLSQCPNDVLIEIFLRLPYIDIVRSSLVCRQWNDIIYNHRFWFQKLKTSRRLEHLTLDELKHVEIADLQRLVALNAFERNLVEDDYYKDKPKLDIRWSDRQANRRRRHEWKIEAPPIFLNPQRLDTEHMDECGSPFQCCMVSSFTECRRSITINLLDYGLTREFLNSHKPTIVITEYYANRGDCACEYNISTLFRNSEERDITSDPLNSRVLSVTAVIEQWEDQYWRKAELVYSDYPDDLYLFDIVTTGRDRQFWAGNYGVKVAGTSVVVKFNFNK